MPIVLTVTVADPAQLVPLWSALAGRSATVNVDPDHVWIDVDLTSSDPVEPARPQAPESDQAGGGSPPSPPPATQPAKVIELDRSSRERHPTSKPDPEPAGRTCADVIAELLAAEPGEEFSAGDIIDAVEGAWTPGTVKFTIAELARAGRIVRVRRGVFCAAPAS